MVPPNRERPSLRLRRAFLGEGDRNGRLDAAFEHAIRFDPSAAVQIGELLYVEARNRDSIKALTYLYNAMESARTHGEIAKGLLLCDEVLEFIRLNPTADPNREFEARTFHAKADMLTYVMPIGDPAGIGESDSIKIFTAGRHERTVYSVHYFDIRDSGEAVANQDVGEQLQLYRQSIELLSHPWPLGDEEREEQLRRVKQCFAVRVAYIGGSEEARDILRDCIAWYSRSDHLDASSAVRLANCVGGIARAFDCKEALSLCQLAIERCEAVPKDIEVNRSLVAAYLDLAVLLDSAALAEPEGARAALERADELALACGDNLRAAECELALARRERRLHGSLDWRESAFLRLVNEVSDIRGGDRVSLFRLVGRVARDMVTDAQACRSEARVYQVIRDGLAEAYLSDSLPSYWRQPDTSRLRYKPQAGPARGDGWSWAMVQLGEYVFSCSRSPRGEYRVDVAVGTELALTEFTAALPKHGVRGPWRARNEDLLALADLIPVNLAADVWRSHGEGIELTIKCVGIGPEIGLVPFALIPMEADASGVGLGELARVVHQDIYPGHASSSRSGPASGEVWRLGFESRDTRPNGGNWAKLRRELNTVRLDAVHLAGSSVTTQDRFGGVCLSDTGQVLDMKVLRKLCRRLTCGGGMAVLACSSAAGWQLLQNRSPSGASLLLGSGASWVVGCLWDIELALANEVVDAELSGSLHSEEPLTSFSMWVRERMARDNSPEALARWGGYVFVTR